MSNWIYVCLLCGLLGGLGCQQDSALPTPAALLVQAQTFMGSSDNIPAFINAHALGAGPHGLFETQVVSALDGRMLFNQLGSTGERFVAGTTTAAGWILDWEADQRTPADSVTYTFLRGHELHMLALAPQTRMGTPQGVHTETFALREAYAVTYYDMFGAPLLWFVAGDNGQPLGIRQINHTGQGAREIDVYFQEWQDVGDLHLFTEATFHQGDDRYHYQYTTLDLDAVADSIFLPTAASFPVDGE